MVHVELSVFGVDAHAEIEKADTGGELGGDGEVLGAHEGDVGFCAAWGGGLLEECFLNDNTRVERERYLTIVGSGDTHI